jgi:hypothetical protein
MEKIFNGYLDSDLIKHYPSGFHVDNFFDFVSNKVNIEGVLSVAGILCPDFILKDEYVFHKINYETFRKYGRNTPYGNDRWIVEKFVNLFCLSDFFYESDGYAQTFLVLPNSDNNGLYIEFARVLEFYWHRRLSELFPDREFIFEISEDGILEEDGVCITFYQEK